MIKGGRCNKISDLAVVKWALNYYTKIIDVTDGSET